MHVGVEDFVRLVFHTTQTDTAYTLGYWIHCIVWFGIALHCVASRCIALY